MSETRSAWGRPEDADGDEPKRPSDRASSDRGALAEAREKMGPAQVLLGNLNPVTVLRAGTPESVWQAVAECHRAAGARYIVGAGCEVPRDTPPENVRTLFEFAKSAQP